ncbi:hypothetical protein ACHAWU_000182 [Discostella pseudostelligera]|uniref:RING-type domain-containing protein n=1 Tax=Discostella pseudostelligera TaxID=259834 RepID=A0ABD3MW70_9STRA
MIGDGNNSELVGRKQLATRRRRWRVTFGNPALGTYVGYIVTLHPRSRRRGFGYDDAQHEKVDDDDDADNGYDTESSTSSIDSFSSCSSDESSDQDGSNSQRIVAMVNVPPHQVPDGVLNLVRGHRPFIEHVRIVISSSRIEEERYRCQRRNLRAMNETHPTSKNSEFSTGRNRSQTWAHESELIGGGSNRDDYQWATSSAASMTEQKECNNLNMTRGSRATSLDFSSHFSHDNTHAHAMQDAAGSTDEQYLVDEHDNDGDGDKNYHILFVLDSDKSAETFVSELHHRPYTTLDESERCSVYHASHVRGEDGVSLLGPFFASSSTPSNDTAPASSKDEHKCPVCLEMMVFTSKSSSLSSEPPSDSSCSILTTVCNHSFHIDCLSQWQDSPCPVCRYDHSGLNETLSRCHVCANTVRNYVCLICGVISCANGPSSTSFTPSTTSDGATVHPTFQAPSHLGHALQHYEESLHAYALDTETQHVWDFVGEGYVHRLLQNFEDGKIVEGIDPRLLEEERCRTLLNDGLGADSTTLPLTALERSTIPTYSSSAEDDEALHRKLEGFAGQYYILLKSQLEQQRIYYEGQLEAIRRQNENSTRNERPSASDIISALKQERNHLEQRCMTLRRKHKKVAGDVVFLENMNESLEADKQLFRRQIADAQAELSDAMQLTNRLLTPLEEKVSLLIHELEHGISCDADEMKPPAVR